MKYFIFTLFFFASIQMNAQFNWDSKNWDKKVLDLGVVMVGASLNLF